MLPFTGFFIPSSVGGGVSGLSTADGGTAIADNALIRGDGTTGIQGGVLTSADHNGDIAGPTASTDTTVAGSNFANQPSNDSITVVSSDAGDTAITVTLIGTTTGTDTVVVEDLPLNGTDATTPVVSAKLNWGQLLAVKVTGTTAGTLTLTETSGGLTITTLAPAATSKGVDTGSISAWNRGVGLVCSGTSTKQIGLKGTNSAGATIYDSQALSNTNKVISNSSFVTISEYYVGDVESTRTVAISAVPGVLVSELVIPNGSGPTIHGYSSSNIAASMGGIGFSDGTVTIYTSPSGPAGNPVSVFSTSSGGGGAIQASGGASWRIICGTDATATSPAFSPRGVFDGDTGIGTAGSDVLSLIAGGLEAMRLTENTDVTVSVPASAGIGWSATTPGTNDTGLARSAAGVVKVTDGSTGDGSIRVAVGSAAAPSFAFDDDTGTGIYRQAAGKVGLAGNGQAGPYFDGGAFQFNGNGNLVIGFGCTVEANTAGVGSPNILTVQESQKVLTNEGTTAKNYHTLPAGQTSWTYTFVVQDADGLRITANTGDTIRVIDKVTAAAGYIESTTIGSVVTLVAINSDEWIATSIHGVWTDGTFTYDDTGLTSP